MASLGVTKKIGQLRGNIDGRKRSGAPDGVLRHAAELNGEGVDDVGDRPTVVRALGVVFDRLEAIPSPLDFGQASTLREHD